MSILTVDLRDVNERRAVVLIALYYKKEDEILTDAYIDGLIAGYFLDGVKWKSPND